MVLMGSKQNPKLTRSWELEGPLGYRSGQALRLRMTDLSERRIAKSEPRSSALAGRLAVRVTFRYATLLCGSALEVEFNEHSRLVAHHPSIVSRFDDHSLRSGELLPAAVGELDMDLAVSEEPDVGVHAEIAAHNRFDVSGPLETGRVNHALNPGGAGAGDVDLDSGDFLVLGSVHGFEQRMVGAHGNVLRGCARGLGNRSRLQAGPCLAHPLRIQQAVNRLEKNSAEDGGNLTPSRETSSHGPAWFGEIVAGRGRSLLPCPFLFHVHFSIS